MPWSWDDEVAGAVLVAVGVAADHDRLRPPGYEPRDALDHDRLAEHDAAEDVADRAVGRAPHLLQAELGDPGLVRRDRGALDADAELLDRVGRVDRHLVVGGIPVLDRQVVVPQVDVQVRQDQIVLDELPDDAGHLVAVEFDDGIGHLDLGHANGSLHVCSSNTRATPAVRLTGHWYHEPGNQQADAEHPEDRHIEQPPPR